MIRINLLEKKGRLEQLLTHIDFFIIEIFLLSLIVVVLFVVMFFITKNLNYQASIVQNEINALNSQLRPLKKRKVEMDNAVKSTNNLITNINTILSLKEKQRLYYLLLVNLEKNIPDDCWINSLSYSGNNSVEMTVNALRSESVTVFSNNLKMNDFFSKISLVRVRTTSEKNFNINEFRITFNINEASL
jgi:Tfp pilus assembly protein PilN